MTEARKLKNNVTTDQAIQLALNDMDSFNIITSRVYDTNGGTYDTNGVLRGINDNHGVLTGVYVDTDLLCKFNKILVYRSYGGIEFESITALMYIKNVIPYVSNYVPVASLASYAILNITQDWVS